jgi:hypothetical protein
LRHILEQVQKAAAEPQQRLFIENPSIRRTLAGIAGPLKLGTMSQTHFVLSPQWADHFARMHFQAGGGPTTVARLREWIDQPRAMGLTPDVQNLVVLAYAAQADRTLVRHGAPTAGSIDRLDGELELREQPLPDEAVWARARERAGSLFGLAPGEVRKGATVSQLAADLKNQATSKRPLLADLATALGARMEIFGVSVGAAPRMVTLRSASALIADTVAAPDPLATINVLAGAELLTSEAAVGRALGSASSLRSSLAGIQWDAIDAAVSLRDHRATAAEAIRTRAAEALEADEHVLGLQSVLQDVQSRAIRLLADTGQTLSPCEVVIEERPPVPIAATEAVALLDDLRRRVSTEPDATLTIGWRLTRPGRGVVG